MPEPAMDELSQLPARMARLETDVGHIKNDVADIKVELRRVDDKLGVVDARLHQVEKEMTEKFGALKVWVLGLYVGQAASLLYVLAKGFKWI